MNFDLQPTLVGQVLRARPLHVADFDALYRVSSDPLVWEQHPSKDRGELAVFQCWFDDAVASGGALTIEDAETRQVIGSSRFAVRGDKTIEIGWTFLARDRWGGKVNGELKHLMLAHAFTAADTVVFIVHDANFRSQRAVAKLGAREVSREPDCQGRGINIRFELICADFGAVQSG